MKKKNLSEERLTITFQKKKRMPNNPTGKGGEFHRFRLGQSGNPAGRPPQAVRVRELISRMSAARPPRDFCEQLGIDPRVTVPEALLQVLTLMGMGGDVSAAREVLSALGFSGTAARNHVLVNVENPEQRGITFELLRHAHGISEADMGRVFEFMDSLPREKPVVDASYFPDESYCEGEPQQLTEGSNTTQEGEQTDV